jgi:hypothetical protein
VKNNLKIARSTYFMPTEFPKSSTSKHTFSTLCSGELKRGNSSKIRQGRVTVLFHCTSFQCRRSLYLQSFIWIRLVVSDLFRGQEKETEGRTDIRNGDFSFDLFSHFSHTKSKKDTQVKTEWIGWKKMYQYLLFSKSHKYHWVFTDGQTKRRL